ncbi:glycoside hydrolase family 2 protein [Streptomyces sp. ACA25]|uniref:glycoside hydrolase family 2 protein n=1 Tax=Streptomyces sp. ACA25 TaxID=3022596 RepID=UPI002306E3FD|nr:glycoside hydrolase family 2 protein [Streptomyces sp. ACA25]MDB1089835.1 glycoside hydrolase family 2 protein [Streptomyces sp. ACA25]
MMRQTLHDGWQLSAVGGPVPGHIAGRSVPAAVPGSAHLDLLAAGLIPDPYLDRHEEDLTWAHRTEWRYRRDLTARTRGPQERVDLVFDGLDTVATVELAGRRIGSTANMHRGYRFDVREVLTGGRDELVVTFRSALEYAEEIQKDLGERPRAYPHPFNMVRKMACSFGWDWGPDLQTAGIWKPVRLERWHTARLAALRPVVTVRPDGTGRAEVHVDIERSGLGPDGPLTLSATVDGRTARSTVPAGASAAVVTVEVPDARLWWPAGYGEQPLYDLLVELRAPGDPEPLDAADRRIGFRTVTVDTTPDETGTPFTFLVNGTPVFAKGANWIPDDHFLTRITRQRLERRVDQALGAHMNMLRVWGGGIYETEDFYDVCDERGVLVWQDFPFACAAYAEEEPLWGEVEAEARENIARIGSHASLALWNGNNENLWGFRDWGWTEELAGRSWGLRYYTELLPRLVAELDPARAYVEGSPYSPAALDELHPNDQDHGSRHEWEVWNQVDYTHYRDHIPRFCSEFGFQGPATWATLTASVHDEPMTPTSPGFLLHQKAEDGNGKLDRGLAPHLPVPEGFADWHWATQLNQARAVSFGIEHFRSWWPRTAGALVWQLNDCWPVTSWAAVDGYERLKPLWYGLRHAYAPRLLTVQPRDARQVLVAVNDTDTVWSGPVHLERQTFGGAVRADARIFLDVPARSVAELALPEGLTEPDTPNEEVLVATADGTRAVHLFGEDRCLAYSPRPLEAAATAVPGGYRVDVRAVSFARDIAVLADRVAPDAEVDDMLVSLPAGATHSFTVRTAAELDPAVLTAPAVLRCANDLCAPAGKP